MTIMKRTINSTLRKSARCLGLLAMLSLGTSCEKSLMDYEGPESIYFSMQWQADPETDQYENYTELNMMTYPESEIKFGFNVKITGDAKDYDRPYRIGIVADKTTAEAGTDYILPEGGVIKAGELTDSLYVTLIKNEKLEEASVILSVQVLPNEHFSTSLAQFSHDDRESNRFDPRVFDLTFTAMMAEPYEWPINYEYYGYENGDLGFFTKKKITLVNELYGLTYADWLEEEEGGTGEIDSIRRQVIAKRFARYLIEQYKNGTPVLEEDGRLMWAEGCPWDSYPGVPWDGTFIEIDD